MPTILPIYLFIGFLYIVGIKTITWTMKNVIEAVKAENAKMLRRIIILQYPNLPPFDIDVVYKQLVNNQRIFPEKL